MSDDFDFGPLMVPVAIRLWGEPKRGATKTEIKFGDGRTVNPIKGQWSDFQGTPKPGHKVEGGGVLALVDRELGLKGRDAIEWLRREVGADIPEDRPASSGNRQRASGTSPHGSPSPAQTPVREARKAKEERPEPKRSIERVFPYVNEAGETVFEVVRFLLTYPDGTTGKTYGQRRPALPSDPPAKVKGGYVWSVSGDHVVPYRLPELLEDIRQGMTIFFAEGEKVVDRLRAEGIPATCNPMGAGKWWPQLTPWFEGADVVILPDNDPQATKSDGSLRFHADGRPVYVGKDHADLVGSHLQGVARSVRVLDLPVPQDGSDAFDWFDEGGTAEALFDLVDTNAFDWIPPETPFLEGEAPGEPEPAAPVFQNYFGGITWRDLDLPAREHQWLVKNIVTLGEVAMMAGASGSGKTFEALNLAMSVARGVPYWGNRVLPGGVIYQAGEGGDGVKMRLRAYRKHHGLTPEDDFPLVLMPRPIDLFASDDQTNLYIAECRYWASTFSVPLRLNVIDTLSSATPGADENSSKDIGPVLARCARISRETGATTLLVHHLNAGGTKVRGHSSIRANVDSVILVELLEGRQDIHGAKIREGSTAKVKDGRDDRKWRFVLKSVELGRDADDEAITSCVVDAADEGAMAGVEREGEIADAKLSTQGANFLRAIYRALDEHGGDPPPELHLPKDVKVVDWTFVREAFQRIAFPKSDDPAKNAEALKKAATRHGEYLMERGILMKGGRLVWLTGKRVRGFKHRKPPSLDAATLPDDADDLF